MAAQNSSETEKTPEPPAEEDKQAHRQCRQEQCARAKKLHATGRLDERRERIRVAMYQTEFSTRTCHWVRKPVVWVRSFLHR